MSARPSLASARSVLIVEDDAAVRALLQELLGGVGMSVTAVGFAEDALKIIRACPPELILLDLGMPAGMMQGMDLLATLRETQAWKAIPVVILSAFGDVINRDVTSRLGVSAVLSKPLLDLEGLLRTIEVALA